MAVPKQGTCAVAEPAKRSVNKRPRKSGRVKLSEAAEKTVGSKWKQIAASLLSSTLKGNASSAKLLLALAKEKTEASGETTLRRLGQLAREFAEEPEWAGAVEEHEAETKLRQFEPEC